MGQKIRGCCLYNPQGQLMKVIVSFLTPDTTCLDFHKHVKDQLITKYGKPHKDYELYQSPYAKGDGFAEQAIKMNKSTIAAFWISDEGNCMLKVTKELAVNISYEAKDWGTEAERRQSESAKDL
jgi:hypothetical protein